MMPPFRPEQLPAKRKTSLSGHENVFHHQHAPHIEYNQSAIVIDQTKLKVVRHFTYLGCKVSLYSKID